MTYPFPGMNPWLEQPGLWEDFHESFIVAMRDALNRLIRPNYWAAIEKRVYIVRPNELLATGRLDVGLMPTLRTTTALAVRPNIQAAEPVLVELPEEEIKELYLEIRKPRSAEVVTAIELLSPANKQPGEGRLAYERKRHAILRSQTHFIEIDFLRGNEPLFFHPRRNLWPYDYRILVSRAPERPQGQLYSFTVRDPIPSFAVPLLPGDAEPTLDLNPIVRDVYTRAAYDAAIDYARPPLPPLAPEDAAWAAQMLVNSEQ